MAPQSTRRAWNTRFDADSIYSPARVPVSNAPLAGSFTRPFAETLAQALNEQIPSPPPLPQNTDYTVISKQFGSAYVIDPLATSYLSTSNGNVPTNSQEQEPAAIFPASASIDFFNYLKAYPTSSAWVPWAGAGTVNPYTWPIRRVTFRETATGWHMGKTTAEHYFRGSDDLSYDFPSRDDRPAIQMWDTNGPTPLARKWAGDYSWIATVAPTTNAARDGMAHNPEGFEYNVSVVVFYKRQLSDSADDVYPALGGNLSQYLSAMSQNERAVLASVVSTGLNGGELLLTDWGSLVDTKGNKLNAFDNLKANQWIMLCGPHPNSSASDPKLALNWYQIISIEQPPTTMWGYNGSYQQRVVTLRGPEWPWQPSTVAGNISNSLCAGIFKGAVAVNSKTMRLESGSGLASGGGAVSFGSSAGSGSTGQPPNVGFPH
jgi:hypothetical protein